jgi:hypothetical protein
MPRKYTPRGAPITFQCEYCGRSFDLLPSRVRRRRGRFCSSRCASVRPLEQRFWAKVKKSDDPLDCWVWTGGKDSHGYGVIRVGDSSDRSHRVSWVMHRGPIPDGFWVLHRCDNPPCIRPDHLFLGTVSDNNRDRHQKGRSRGGKLHGTAVGHAKLTEESVFEARVRYAMGGMTCAQLGEEYGVCGTVMAKAVNGKTWAHVPFPKGDSRAAR